MTSEPILLSDPDISHDEIDAIEAVLCGTRLSQGPQVESVEKQFADYLERSNAIATSSGTMALTLCLRAYNIGAGDEVICSGYSWHQIQHAIAIVGAKPVLVDIDYWSGTISPEKIRSAITPKTRAVLAGNTNGHPAMWEPLRAIANEHNLTLLEDSTEAIGSRYRGQLVGTFGDCSIFDFSQPSALVCGEGAMIVTNNETIALRIRQIRHRRIDERASVVLGSIPPLQATMSELTAVLLSKQLARIDSILDRRKDTELVYFNYVKSFEGIKDPYIAPDVDEVHWFLYSLHLGTRFSKSSRDAIIDDMKTAGVEAAAYCHPLHRQAYYRNASNSDALRVTEKVSDRVLVLPFHAHLTDSQIAFIVQTMKDASINVGAGAAIYL